MYGKLDRILVTAPTSPSFENHQRHNRWDKEFGELMCSAEKRCTKYREGWIEFSPAINLLNKWKSLFQWILCWHEGKTTNTHNLLRKAMVQKVANPLALSVDEVWRQLDACIANLAEKKKATPSLCCSHLLRLQDKAKKEGRDKDAKELERILKKEAIWSHQNRINRAVKLPQGWSIMQVQLEDPRSMPEEEATIYTSETDIVKECNQWLRSWFQLGKWAPISVGQMATLLGD